MKKHTQPLKTVIQESDEGAIYRANAIPGCLFNFYAIQTKRQYKDGTHRWDICVELAANPKQHMRITSVRGEKKHAVARLDELLKHGQ